MTYDISYSVVRMTMRFDKRILAVGSGFLYIRNKRYYIVTAWHNLSGRHSENLKPLASHGGIPNNIIVDMPTKITKDDGSYYTRMPIRLDINREGDSGYRVHTQKWPRVDVAVIEFAPENDFNIEIYLSTGETREFNSSLLFYDGKNHSQQIALVDSPVSIPLPDDWEAVHTVGDPLFLLGFPAGLSDESVTPIWKRATIASEPSRKWRGQSQILVDSASRKGMSGGLAIYYDKKGNVPTFPGSSLQISRPLYIVHGVYVGRLGDSEFEAQVGVVWKKEILDEIIDHGCQAISSEEIELAPSNVSSLIEVRLHNMSDVAVYLEDKPPIGYLLFSIMEELEGRANPDFVISEIRRIISVRS